MSAPEEVKQLVTRFAANEASYTSASYLEASVRQDFLDPFFRALGWDVGNAAGLPEFLRDVVVESRLRVDGMRRAPDYAFRIAGIQKFFVEAKKPSVVIASDPTPAHQVRSYGWNGRVAYSLLTDFHELSLYDTRLQPAIGDRAQVARLNYLTYDQYVDEWDWIAERFDRESVAAGALDRIAADERVRHRTVPVDEAILGEIEEWRRLLSADVYAQHPDLSAFELGMAVQLLLDRIFFLRICEDRGIEAEGNLQEIAAAAGIYQRLLEVFERADRRYNSGLFHLLNERGRSGDRDTLTPRLRVSDDVLRSIIESLYWPQSAFNFRMLGTQVLGNVYEQFLGSVVTLRDGSVTVEEKPEVAKAGGVVYTPEMVVEHILEQTLDIALNTSSLPVVSGSSRAQYSHPLRVLDPACGSGSFLIAAYQHLLDWYLSEYLKSPEPWLRGSNPRLFVSATGEYLLTTAERKRILLDHVYGVDIDHQAVEVTKLSLLLKVLENESAESVDQQLTFLHERVLPDLSNNIKCGNTLIDQRYYGLEPTLADNEDRSRRINPFNWNTEFPAIFNVPRPGFDVVIGNPPYVVLQDSFRDDYTLSYLHANYVTPAFKVDLYHVFMEKSAALTRTGGWCSLITPSNWLTNNYLVGLRKFMLSDTSLTEVAILDRSVFARRSVDCAIYVARIGTSPATQFAMTKYVPDAGNNRLTLTQSSAVSVPEVRKSTHLLITGGGEAVASAAIDKMRQYRSTLGSLATVNFGKQLRNRKVYTTDVIRTDASIPGPPAEGYAHCYTGGDISRWAAQWSGLSCLTDRSAKMGGCWDDRWQNATNKLLCRQVGLFPDFAIDPAGYQCLNTMFMVNVTTANVSPWFLLGVLNSTPLRAYWLDRFWDRRRTFPKIKGTYLKELPIPATSDEVVEATAEAITRYASELRGNVSSTRRQQLNRAIAASEEALDARVAELFGLADADLAALSALVDEAIRRD